MCSSRDAVERVAEKHRLSAATRCRSLQTKRVSPHVLRHTNAMMLLQARVDRSVIALWLGHESVDETTEIYLHADLSIKERAIARTAPLRVGGACGAIGRLTGFSRSWRRSDYAAYE